jgi:PTH1 family peptidyl-tRNA hydrolase
LANVIDCVGRGDFPRLRFGVGRSGEPSATTVDWVLQDFSDDEESALNSSVESAAAALAMMAQLGVTPAMNRYNRAPDILEAPADISTEGDSKSVDTKDKNAM